MDLNIRTTETGASVDNWLASSHGLDALRNVTLKNSDLGVEYNVPNTAPVKQVVPSGTPLSYDEVDGVYVPYVEADAEAVPAVVGTGALICLLYADVEVTSGTYSHGAGLDHGKAIAAKLPVVLSAEAKASNPRIQFV